MRYTVIIVLLLCGVATAGEVRVVSGEGNLNVGDRDPKITFYRAQVSGHVTGADTTSGLPSHHPMLDYAVKGERAYVTTVCTSWRDKLNNSKAKWISSHPRGGNWDSNGGTGTFAIPFNLPAGASNVQINLKWSADNVCWAYLNGKYVGRMNTKIGNFTRSDMVLKITDLETLRTGDLTNYIQIYLVELHAGSPNGVIFDLSVVYNETTPPEPPKKSEIEILKDRIKELENENSQLKQDRDEISLNLDDTIKELVTIINTKTETISTLEKKIDTLTTSVETLTGIVETTQTELAAARDVLLLKTDELADQGQEYFTQLADMFTLHLGQVTDLTGKVDKITEDLLAVHDELKLARVDITSKNRLIADLVNTVSSLEDKIQELIDKAPEIEVPELVKLNLRLKSSGDEPVQSVFEMEEGTLLTIQVSGTKHPDSFYEVELRRDDIEGELVYLDHVDGSRASLIKNFPAPFSGKYFIHVRYNSPHPEGKFLMKVKGKRSKR